MIALFAALALAVPTEHLPALGAALGCEAPEVVEWRAVAELPGVVGWAVAGCDAPRVVVLGDAAAWVVATSGDAPKVHGFLDLTRRLRGLQKVGVGFKLSAGPHGYQRPAMLVTTSERLMIVEASPEGAVVRLDVGRHDDVAVDPGHFTVTVDGVSREVALP